MAVEHDVVSGDAARDLVLAGEIDCLGQIVDITDRLAIGESSRQFESHLLAHAVSDHIGPSIAENTGSQLILPVVVMRQSAQRGFDASQHDWHIGEELFEDTGIDDRGIFRTHVVTPIGTIGILRAQATVGCIFVDHRVHTARSDAEEEARAPQFLEVAIVAVPVGLRNDGHPISGSLESSSDDCRPKRGVVDIRITREQDDIEFIPSSEFQLLLGRWQKIRQSIFHSYLLPLTSYFLPLTSN